MSPAGWPRPRPDPSRSTTRRQRCPRFRSCRICPTPPPLHPAPNRRAAGGRPRQHRRVPPAAADVDRRGCSALVLVPPRGGLRRRWPRGRIGLGPDGPPSWPGPQGRVPQFVVRCAFSHSSFDDPIVHPGHRGASHLHQFFGNHSTAADPTYESLIAADTTCNDQRRTLPPTGPRPCSTLPARWSSPPARSCTTGRDSTSTRPRLSRIRPG